MLPEEKPRNPHGKLTKEEEKYRKNQEKASREKITGKTDQNVRIFNTDERR